jgi:hypothetical protein
MLFKLNQVIHEIWLFIVYVYSLTLFVPTPAVNQRADQLAGDAVENGIEWFDFLDFLSLSRVRRLDSGWQSG